MKYPGPTLRVALLSWLLVLLGPAVMSAGSPPGVEPQRHYLMTHYMPWFEAKPFDTGWGWHWTMNHFNPEKISHGQQEIASYDTPLTGPYASDDPDLLEYQVLLMKFSGIDGVIFDWYGPNDFADYGLIHRNCEKMAAELKKARLKFAVCFEDQTLPHLIDAKRITAAESLSYGQGVMRWLGEHWFQDPGYLKLANRPVFLVFGPQYYSDDAWPRLFAPLTTPPAFFTLHVRRADAEGAFDWPRPAPGPGLEAVDEFYRRSTGWPVRIPVAFPRFHDIYKEAGVSAGYGIIPDDNGRTYETLLNRALQSKAPIIQLATWNDWGEGTQIEPSTQSGYRDLEITQQSRRRIDHSFKHTAADLRVPLELFTIRKRLANNQAAEPELEAVSRLLFQGKVAQALPRLRRLETRFPGKP